MRSVLEEFHVGVGVEEALVGFYVLPHHFLVLLVGLVTAAS